MSDKCEDSDVYSLESFYNEISEIKDNKISEFIDEKIKKHLNLNEEKNRAYIINLCFDNIIDSKNLKKNYILTNILFERGSVSKNKFSQDKLSKIYNKFIENFYSEKEKEAKGYELKLNKGGSSSNIQKSDLPNINIQIRFLAKIYYLFSDKKDLIKLINEEILNNKIKINKKVAIEEILKNKNNFEKQEFLTKEESNLFIHLFLEINYLENKIEYDDQNNYNITKINQELNNILYFDEFFDAFNNQKNIEIINDMCKLIYNLYKKGNKIKKLISKCKDIFQYNIEENMNILHLLKYIIINTEKDYLFDIKPHYLLLKKNIIKINFEEKNDKVKEIYFFGNSTINQIYHYLIENNNTKSVVYYINNNAIDEIDKIKSLKEFDKKVFKISKKDIGRDRSTLLKEGKLTQQFKEVLENWFNIFSKGKDKLTRNDLADCFNILVGKKESKYTSDKIKILIFLKYHSDNLDFILLDKFINFFYSSIIKEKENDVWMNIENMNLRNNLTQLPKIMENKFLLRYYLSNETEENKDLYLMDIFKKKYKNSLNKSIYDFIFFLSTDEKIYDEILKNFNKDENMKFSKRKEEYLYNLYIMNIIESIFEDVEFKNDNNNKFKEFKVCENDYYLYKTENNIDLKIKFVVEFLKNNYSDLIDYSIKILENINKIEKEKIDMESQYTAIKLCEKNIKFISRIYSYYNNIYFENKTEEIIPLKSSLKEFIEKNNLSKEVNEQKNYKDIFFQLLKFLDLFYIKEDKNQEITERLMDDCFYLFISLLFNNKYVFDEFKNKSEKNELLENVLKFIISSESQKHKRYIAFLLRINSFREEIHIFLIDLSFQLLKEIGDKKFLSAGITYISKNLLSNGINKENIKEKIKEEILAVFHECLKDNSKNKKLNAFMQVILKLFEKQNQFKNQLIEGKYKNEKIYDLIYQKINEREEEKLKKKFEKYENIKNLLLLENDKFIPYDKIKKQIEENLISKNIKVKRIDNNNINNNEQNKNIIDFLISCFQSYNDNNPIKTKIGMLITSLKNLINEEAKNCNENINNIENNKILKKKSPYVGLKNLGSLCYINSIIQQLFFIEKFKYSILSADDAKPPDKSFYLTDDDNILHQTQKLFTYLSFSSSGEFIPKNFIFSLKYFGNRIELNKMLDSSEFYLNFLEQISVSLENTKYKNIINDLFCGNIQEKKVCSECGNTSYKDDEFKLISLEVREMKDIFQSFEKYISEEIIEGYKCDKCNKEVNLKKSTIISSLPNVLVIHLNRMKYNNNGELKKIINKFDFPLELNIKNYCIKNNLQNEDYYKYQLKGINIHNGSAKAGHYISLIKTSKEEKNWYLFDDSFIKAYDFNNFEEEFNKNENKNCAYILFYEAIQEKQLKSDIKKYLPKEYLLEVFNDNKTYELLYENKIIDINNELVKILLQKLDNESFKIKDNKMFYEIRDLIDIFSELIINYYSNENYIKIPEQKNIKSLINVINKIFLSPIKSQDIFESSDVAFFCKHIMEKFFSEKNLKLIFTTIEMNELNEAIYQLIHTIILKNKTHNFINSKEEFQEKISSIISNEKNISVYLYKILYELVTYNPDNRLLEIDSNTFLDIFYKVENENLENLEEINKILDYYLNKKNILEKSEKIKTILKECSHSSFFKLIFDNENDTLIKLIEKIQYNDENASNQFNMKIIQKLYDHCLADKENDKIRLKQIKLMKIIFSILDIRDKFVLKRIKILLGFPTLIMIPSNDIITKFGINLLNNDINKEMYEYSNFNLIKKGRCILSYLFPSYYYKNEENKLEEKDKCDLIYELINRALGINNKNEGNYFLFKTLYLMQPRSIKYENLYQEMKSILGKGKYNLDKIIEVESEVIKYVENEVNNTMNFILYNKKDGNQNQLKVPNIYFKWEKLISDDFGRQFIGCISNIFPYEIGKIEINMKTKDILRFKFYTTYFTKQELSKLTSQNKPFVYENLSRDSLILKKNKHNSNNEEEFRTDFSILKEKKNIKQLIEYFSEKLKEKKAVIIENSDILNKYEVKNTFNRYYIYGKDKKKIANTNISTVEIGLDEINNCYLPENICNLIEENQIINFLNVHRIKSEFRFFENNDIQLHLKLQSYEKYFKDI